MKNLATILISFLASTMQLALAQGNNDWCIKDPRNPPCHGQAGRCTYNADGSPGGFVANTAKVEKLGHFWQSNRPNKPYIGIYAQICEKAQIKDDVRIEDDAVISGQAVVKSSAKVNGRARVGGKAKVKAKAQVGQDANIGGEVVIEGEAKVLGSIVLLEKVRVKGNVTLTGDQIHSGNKVIERNPSPPPQQIHVRPHTPVYSPREIPREMPRENPLTLPSDPQYYEADEALARKLQAEERYADILQMATVDFGHLERYKRTINFQKNKDLKDVKKVDIRDLITMFDAINFSNPRRPGYIPPIQRHDVDSTGKKFIVEVPRMRQNLVERVNAIRGRNEFFGVSGSDRSVADLETKMKKITKLLWDADLYTRNSSLTTMSIMSGHCGFGFTGELTHIEGMLETNFDDIPNFPKQVDTVLKNLRKDLINKFNTSPETETAQGTAYWLHLLGQDLGVPEAVQFSNFQWTGTRFLGRNADLSKQQALKIFYRDYYTHGKIAETLKLAINEALKNSKNSPIQFSHFNEWLEANGINKDEILEEDEEDYTYKITSQGVYEIMLKLGIIKIN